MHERWMESALEEARAAAAAGDVPVGAVVVLVASLYGLVRGGRTHRVVRDGLLFGSGLWLLGDELAVPLLGLGDKPTAYHPTLHLQMLLAHLGFGVATAGATQLLEARR